MICIAETFHCVHTTDEINAFEEKLINTVIKINEALIYFACFYDIIQNEKTPLVLIKSAIKIANSLLKGNMKEDIIKTMIGKNIDVIDKVITQKSNDTPQFAKVKEEYETFIIIYNSMKHLMTNEDVKIPTLNTSQKNNLKELFSNEDLDNHVPICSILSNTIDNLVEGSKNAQMLHVPNKKILNNFDFKENEQEIENENIIIATTGDNRKIVTFISLNLLASKFTTETFYTINIPSIRKYCMEQKLALFSEEVVLTVFKSYYNKTHAEEYIEMLNLYLINNFNSDIASNPELKKEVREMYELISRTKSSIKFCNNTIETKEIVTLLEDFDPAKIYYRLQKLGNIESVAYPINPPLPIYQSVQLRQFQIDQLDMVEIARQMSVVTHFLYRKIENCELCNCNWMKKDKETSAPNITKLIVRFNQIAFWICEEILAYDKEQDRAKVIQKLIILADELRKMKNYNDCYNIITAFSYLPVKRLNKTWAKVNIDYIDTLKDINELCSLGGNFSNLRKEFDEYKKMENKSTGCVPYVGYFLKKLAFLDEGPKYFKDDLINPEKINKIGEVMEELKYFQQFRYSYTPVFSLAFLADPKPPTEQILLEISDQLEPNFTMDKNRRNEKRPTSVDSIPQGSFGPNYAQFLKDNSEKVTKTMSLKEKLLSLKKK